MIMATTAPIFHDRWMANGPGGFSAPARFGSAEMGGGADEGVVNGSFMGPPCKKLPMPAVGNAGTPPERPDFTVDDVTRNPQFLEKEPKIPRGLTEFAAIPLHQRRGAAAN
jgi:hypothetical protein